MASRSWNRVELIGNLTRDPELRYTPSGAAVCTFSIATNRTYVSDGEKKEEVDFHRCVSWNKLAELCSQLLKKGNRAFISGRLQNRSWEGQDGQTRNVTEIVIEDMIVLSPKTTGEVSSISAEEAAFAEPPPKPAPKAEEEPEVTEEKKPEESASAPASPTLRGASKAPADIGSPSSDTKAPKEEVDESDLPF